MVIRSFKDIVAWQNARDLTIDIYATFQDCRDYSYKDQIQRASIFIMNNIAEGYAKRSDKSFRNFLMIAKGSTAEVESMLLIAPQLGYINPGQQTKLISQTEIISRLITGFARKLSASDS